MTAANEMRKALQVSIAFTPNGVFLGFLQYWQEHSKPYDLKYFADSPLKFWSLADLYPDLVNRLHIKSDSWVIYALTVAFLGSLILWAHFVLYAKKTLKRYITTTDCLAFRETIALCGLT